MRERGREKNEKQKLGFSFPLVISEGPNISATSA